MVREMRNLQIGDEIAVSWKRFSPVIGFTHRSPIASASYVQIRTESGHAVVATVAHMMYVIRDGQKVPTGIEEIIVGDEVPVVQDGRDETSVVISVKRINSVGLFNPHTLSGDIVVNGVLCSTYTKYVPMYTAHCLLAPIRAGYRIASLITTFQSR